MRIIDHKLRKEEKHTLRAISFNEIDWLILKWVGNICGKSFFSHDIYGVL